MDWLSPNPFGDDIDPGNLPPPKFRAGDKVAVVSRNRKGKITETHYGGYIVENVGFREWEGEWAYKVQGPIHGSRPLTQTESSLALL